MQITIYIRKENEEKFKQEPQKSDLINLLLSRHYDFYKPGTLIEEVSDESIVGNADLAEKLKEAWISNPVDEPLKLSRLTNGLCKIHGTPLDSRGRCLVKGCKYN